MSYLVKLKNALFGKSDPSTSEGGSINVTDLAKVSRTAILMGLATAVSHLLANVKPDMFGDNAGIATIVIAILGELSLRYIKSNGK
jgi:hypothetical protein